MLFVLDVFRLVRFDWVNCIIVRVFDLVDQFEFPVGLAHIEMYCVSGIWCSVWLEVTGIIYVFDLYVVLDIDVVVVHI